MARVGILAADRDVIRGLERLFARHDGVEVMRLTPDRAGASIERVCSRAAPDLLIVDIWPPTSAAAETACAAGHTRFPRALIVAVVHHGNPALLGRVRRAGGTALWPKERPADLPAFALRLLSRRAPTGAT